nr:hypothetical protein [Tanacetum cinerariifolium]
MGRCVYAKEKVYTLTLYICELHPSMEVWRRMENKNKGYETCEEEEGYGEEDRFSLTEEGYGEEDGFSSTEEFAPAMTQAAIQKLVADSVVGALEVQAANMANTNNTNRNLKPKETLAARKCTYKEFTSCQPFYLNVTEGAVGLIH